MSLCWCIINISATDTKHSKQLSVRLPLSLHAFHTYTKTQESILENWNYMLWLLGCLCTSFQRQFQLATFYIHMAIPTGFWKNQNKDYTQLYFFYQMLPKIIWVKETFVIISFIFMSILRWCYSFLYHLYHLWYSVMKNCRLVNNESTNENVLTIKDSST